MPRSRVIYVRPLLALTRSQTEAACAAWGLTPWIDPTNLETESTAPLRSQIRNVVMPVLRQVLGGDVATSLSRTAAQARDDADALDQLADDLLARAAVVVPSSTGGCSAFDVVVLGAAPRAIRRRALKEAAESTAGRAVTSAHVDNVDALVANWRGQGPTMLPSGATAARVYGRLCFSAGQSQGRDGTERATE
jgi:tRNA(Ile)-lysidine synthase